jgi:hypothetical protein
MATKNLDVKVNVDGQSLRELIDQIKVMRHELKEATDDKQIDKLNKSLKKTEESIEGVNKAVDDFGLGKKFEEVYGELQPLSSRLGELEDRMYELAFAGKAGTEEFAALRSEAANMRQTIIDVDKQVDLLADNKGFSIFGAGISGIGDSLMRLDFAGAEREATGLAKAANKISFGDALSSLKQLGNTFLNLGKAILTNPLFLIAGVVTLIVVGIVKLLDKLGILKKIFDTVGKAVEYVVQALKDFLDWIGLTTFAAEDAAERQSKAQEKVAKAYEDKRNKLVTAYDQEIALAQIAGESTFELERNKQQAIIETSRQQYKALEAQRDAARAAGVLTAEQSKAINESMTALRLGIEGARREIELINAKEVQDNKKKNTDIEKANQDSYKKRIEDLKKYEADRLAAQRLIQDLELELMEMGEQKELEANRIKYERLIADTETNEKLLADEKLRIIAEYRELEFNNEKAIRQRFDDEFQAQVVASTKAREEAKAQEQAEWDVRNAEDNARRLEQQKIYNEAQLAADQSLVDAKLGAAVGLVSALGGLTSKNKAIANAIFAVEKALAIGEVVVSTQREIAGYASNPTWSLLPDGGATIKASYIAAAKIRAATSIATIAASSISKFIGGGGSASVGGGGGASQPQAAAQTQGSSFNLFGQANQGNNASSSQSVEKSMTIIAKVSAVDMTAEQASNKKNMEMATL